MGKILLLTTFFQPRPRELVCVFLDKRVPPADPSMSASVVCAFVHVFAFLLFNWLREKYFLTLHIRDNEI